MAPMKRARGVLCPPGRVRTYLREAVRRVVKKLRPERIILFGSRAHGKPDPWSDVDLLIVLRSCRDPFAAETRLYEMLSDRPVAMDILVHTVGQIEAAKKRSDPFWNDVLEKGKTLYAARR